MTRRNSKRKKSQRRRFRAGSKQGNDLEEMRKRQRAMAAAWQRAQDNKNVACLKNQSLNDWLKRAKVEKECAGFRTRQNRMPIVCRNIENMKDMRNLCNVNRACRRLGHNIPLYRHRRAAGGRIAALVEAREEIPEDASEKIKAIIQARGEIPQDVLNLLKENLVGPDEEALALGCPLPEDSSRIIADYVGMPNPEWPWKFSSKRRKKKSRRRKSRKKRSRKRKKKS